KRGTPGAAPGKEEKTTRFLPSTAKKAITTSKSPSSGRTLKSVCSAERRNAPMAGTADDASTD
ncbi:MAG: hypothetical protein AAFY88_08025, partial [Acidobacteriota bacterium]